MHASDNDNQYYHTFLSETVKSSQVPSERLGREAAKRGDLRGGTLSPRAQHLRVFLAAGGSGGTVPGGGVAVGGVGAGGGVGGGRAGKSCK